MRRYLFVLFAFPLFLLFGCKTSSGGSSQANPGESAQTSASGIEPRSAPPAPAGSINLVIAYGSEKKTWLEEQIKAFEASGAHTKGMKAIHVDAKAMGSGEAVQAILSGAIKPHVFSPASGAYVTVMNRAWLSQAGHTA